MPRFAANLTMLYTEHDFIDRFRYAADDGFKGVEYLFPYQWDAKALRDALQEHQLTQVLFNLPPGDWEAGERGIACHPDRVEEFRAGVELAMDYAEYLGCRKINCLAGLAPKGVAEADLRACLLENVRYAASRLREIGVQLQLEAINSRVDMPGFYLDSAADVVDLIREEQLDNVALQYDIYHMQIMEGDLSRRIQSYWPYIGHIQFADNPGRHEPGTGEINFKHLFSWLDKLGYEGWVSAEYRPKVSTEASFEWLKRLQHGNWL
ncbi:hydroxypyruvate isomerase [Oleiphilus messinensis]|uniref:Hydroxypyruvate isomerase n=1 Tax=Oleiphilus messinensis TaxID=141451 RepID=A0A1Y0I4S5_9GAMM|nr:hydroxypyruvate isomerase [Oleiphilus messinensis]ARU54454.1 hydroxypyruvate isomerase [Oleiphilus messinensis]